MDIIPIKKNTIATRHGCPVQFRKPRTTLYWKGVRVSRSSPHSHKIEFRELVVQLKPHRFKIHARLSSVHGEATSADPNNGLVAVRDGTPSTRQSSKFFWVVHLVLAGVGSWRADVTPSCRQRWIPLTSDGVTAVEYVTSQERHWQRRARRWRDLAPHSLRDPCQQKELCSPPSHSWPRGVCWAVGLRSRYTSTREGLRDNVASMGWKVSWLLIYSYFVSIAGLC